MLHILGLVGKGIGAALLCILILAVIILLAVLFVPIRYRIAGSRDGTGLPRGEVKLHWLFHIVSGSGAWEGRLHYRVRVFGIPFYDNLKKERAEKKKREKEKKKNRKQKDREKKSKQKNSPKRDRPDTAARDAAGAARDTAPAQGREIFPDIRPVSREAWKASGRERPKAKASVFRRIADKIKALWRKIREFARMLVSLLRKAGELPKQIRRKAEKLWEMAADLRKKAEAVRTFLEGEEWKRAFSLGRKQLLRLWKSVRPRTVKADIRFGFADPSATGQVLAFAGMLYPFLGKTIVLRPDFEEQVLEGSVLIRGRITIAVLLRILWVLYFNKDIKRLIRIWKKEETLHGR